MCLCVHPYDWVLFLHDCPEMFFIFMVVCFSSSQYVWQRNQVLYPCWPRWELLMALTAASAVSVLMCNFSSKLWLAFCLGWAICLRNNITICVMAVMIYNLIWDQDYGQTWNCQLIPAFAPLCSVSATLQAIKDLYSHVRVKVVWSLETEWTTHLRNTFWTPSRSVGI